jgi:hypothetical protein
MALTTLKRKSQCELDLAPFENRGALKNAQAQQIDKATHITFLLDAVR